MPESANTADFLISHYENLHGIPRKSVKMRGENAVLIVEDDAC